jgi:hypothetical protein
MSSLQLKYVQQWVDHRNGQTRYYFRRPGFKRVPLPGSPFSEEFERAYTEAMAGQRAPITGRREFLPGTMNTLALSYFNSLSFRSLGPSTQSVYRNLVDRLCKEDGNSRVAKLERKHVVAMMKARADKPDSANGLRRILRALMKYAIEIGMRQDDPTRDVRAIRVKSDGFHPVSEDGITQFEARHPIGSRARLAFALLLYTGQRRSGCGAHGASAHSRRAAPRQASQDRRGVVDTVLPQLQEIIAASSVGQMTFLITEFSNPSPQTVSATGCANNSTKPDCRIAAPMVSAKRAPDDSLRRDALTMRSRRLPATTVCARLHTTRRARTKALATMAMQKLTKREQEVSTPTQPDKNGVKIVINQCPKTEVAPRAG